jgi:RNA polymerase sigma-70 factor (ECF subfamily)
LLIVEAIIRIGQLEHRSRNTIRRCQDGDREAFRLLFHAHGNHLYRVALLITRDPYLAEDAVQECLLSAWKKIRSFTIDTNFRAWLNRILINAIGQIRRKKKLPTAPVSLAISLQDQQSTPEQSALDSETAQMLQSAMETLSLEHRTVIVFRFFNEMSLAEIADSTGWRVGTVKSRLHRALMALRDAVASGDEALARGLARKVEQS